MFETPEVPEMNAWASLLGLLSPSEYFITVDHSVLWQKHVAWAKPKGEDLRQYVTQRFASNMVFLSLMLGAQINVFFNSAVELSQMRTLLQTESYNTLKYWIGIIIALDACVTIIALVATFTLWGMISAISDTNTHALLRSSIGQYVISLPPRFVVSSLYLFIFWLLLFILDIVSGPCRIFLVLIVLFLFFQVVVPLSAFGRLVLHTGAMAKRRVLEEEFEKELLPSGLHASLLIRATGQRRRYTSAINQYRKKSSSSQVSRTSHVSSANGSYPRQPRRQRSCGSEMTSSSRFQTTDDNKLTIDTSQRLGSDSNSRVSTLSKRGHMRTVSGDTFFPRASILNGCTDLKEVVDQAMSEIESEDGFSQENDSERGTSKTEDQSVCNTPTTAASDSFDSLRNFPAAVFISPKGRDNTRISSVGSDGINSEGRPPLRRYTNNNREDSSSLIGSWRKTPTSARRSSAESMIITEWEAEKEVRNQYDATPPAEPLCRTETLERSSSERTAPRPSVLNRITGLQSLKNLFERESMQFDTPDSSVAEVDDLDNSSEEDQQYPNTNWDKYMLSSPAESENREEVDVESGSSENARLLDSNQGSFVVYGRRDVGVTSRPDVDGVKQ